MIQIKVVFWSARGGECCVVYVALQAHCGTPQWRGSGRGEIGAYVAPVVRSCCSILLLAIEAEVIGLHSQV